MHRLLLPLASNIGLVPHYYFTSYSAGISCLKPSCGCPGLLVSAHPNVRDRFRLPHAPL